MAGRNGSGVFTVSNPDFVSGTTISSSEMDANFADVATALTQSIAVDGQTTITGNLPMATYRHTGVGNAAARTDYAAAGQVQDSGLVWGGTAGGTANALTLTLTPAITAYATGQRFAFKAGASPSSSSVTIDINSVGAVAIERDDVALSSSSVIEAGKYYEIIYDGTAFQLSQISAAPSTETYTDSITAGTTQTQAGATALTTEYNQITTCANFLDGVALPAAAAGVNKCIIINAGAQAAKVWPANGSSETIMGGAANAADPVPLAPGELREYYSVDGTDWFTPRSPGQRCLLQSQTASTSASLDFAFAAMGDGTFDTIEVIATNVIPSTDGQGLEMLVSDDLGVSFETGSSYNYSGYDSNQAGQLIGNYNASQASFGLTAGGTGNASGEGGISFDMHCQMANASTFFSYHCRGTYVQETPGYRTFNSGGNFVVAAAYNGLQFKFAGNMASGTIAVYGIVK